MEKIISAIFFLLVCFFFILLLKEKRKYKELKYLQDTEIDARYEKEFEDVVKERKEEIEQLEKEILSKKQFNNSLFKVREEELDRLIEEKRKEREAALEKLLEAERKEKEKMASDDFQKWLNQFEEQKQQYTTKVQELQEELSAFEEKRAAINEAILRERELAEKADFYRIVVPIEDQEDIEVLNTIAPRLRNKEALNKLIYSVFIQRPLDELIKRVTGGREISGIYKITYMNTGEAYIGKTTSIKRRWTEHVKSSLNIGTIAHSSFHDRLHKDGLWNYTFEILEEVPKDQLAEREKFYIQLFGTDTQLNMKVG